MKTLAFDSNDSSLHSHFLISIEFKRLAKKIMNINHLLEVCTLLMSPITLYTNSITKSPTNELCAHKREHR